jgi:hypothetical protein
MEGQQPTGSAVQPNYHTVWMSILACDARFFVVFCRVLATCIAVRIVEFLGLYPWSGIFKLLENTAFRELDVFPS